MKLPLLACGLVCVTSVAFAQQQPSQQTLTPVAAQPPNPTTAPRAVETSRIGWTHYAMFAGGQTFDVVSTIRFLHAGRCTESNPGFGQHPSTTWVVATKAAVGAGAAAAMWILDRESQRASGRARKTLVWLSHGLGYAGGGVGAFDGVRNLANCGR